MRLAIALALGLLVLLLACSAAGDDAPSNGARQGALPSLTIVTATGRQVTLHIELAVSFQERTQGLMGRQALPEDQGMLFVFPQGQPRSGFWMKDTLIPLSVAFVDADGTIVDIQDMAPLSLEIHVTGELYDYGLEVNQGWFARNGVKVGDRLALTGVPEPATD